MGDLSLARCPLWASCTTSHNALPTCIPAYLSARKLKACSQQRQSHSQPPILSHREGEISRVFSKQILILDLRQSPSFSERGFPRSLTRSSTLADQSPQIENAKVPSE